MPTSKVEKHRQKFNAAYNHIAKGLKYLLEESVALGDNYADEVATLEQICDTLSLVLTYIASIYLSLYPEGGLENEKVTD